jgi:hypothetical protein
MLDRSALRQELLRDGIRLIVSTRERTPRSPRWAEAWRRTLFRYVRQLEDMAAGESDEAQTAR